MLCLSSNPSTEVEAQRIMIRIAITPPAIRPDEAAMIERILDRGWSYVHLRHPEASLGDMLDLIGAIPERLHSRLKLHDHFVLLDEFGLGGVHLNRRNPEPPRDFCGEVSRSCHSVSEAIAADDDCAYVTLSPIFPSVSKPGYKGDFTEAELLSIPGGRVVALGGVTPERVEELSRFPFAGYAVLGSLWDAIDMAELDRRLDLFEFNNKQV